jgi:hypothetical protein
MDLGEIRCEDVDLIQKAQNKIECRKNGGESFVSMKTDNLLTVRITIGLKLFKEDLVSWK